MPNVFPSAGIAGIGTATPQAPIHIQSGIVVAGGSFRALSAPNTANAYIQIQSSKTTNYSWQASNQDASGGNTANGLSIPGEDCPGWIRSPVSTSSRVVTSESESWANNGGSIRGGQCGNPHVQNMVQMQGQAVVPGGMVLPLALGYGDNYDSVAVGAAGYIQAEHQGAGFINALLHTQSDGRDGPGRPLPVAILTSRTSIRIRTSILPGGGSNATFCR